MLKIRCSDVPSFLREGAFFQNLDVEDQDVFEVPEYSFKPDLEIDSHRDLLLLLRTVTYWGLSEIPVEVSSYMLRTGDVADHTHLLDEFPDLTPYLKKILHVKSAKFVDGTTDAIQQELGVRVVRLMHKLDYVLSGDCCEAAATVGDLESLMYLHTEGCPWDEQTTTAAVLNNHCDCLQYALDFNCPQIHHLMQIAAEKGTTDTMRCLQSCNVPLNDDAFLSCLRGRKLDNLRYFVESGCTVPDNACMYATLESDRTCLEYLHQRGYALTLMCSINASSGCLPILQYLHEHDCPCVATCCSAAALGNHLDCLQYLHENGCPWDETTVTAAIVLKSWKCLWYALRHGCPCRCLLQLGFSTFAVGSCTYSLLRKYFQEDEKPISMTLVGVFVMSSTNLLSILNEKFGVYYTEYISPQTASSITSHLSFVGVLFSVYYLVKA